MNHNDNMSVGDNMKNKKGFTLVELLAVIVVLSVILVIASSNVFSYINDSKEKTRYLAAKEIVEMSEAYFAINSDKTEATIDDLKVYLEDDTTNPKTGENDLLTEGKTQKVCKSDNYSKQTDYSNNEENGYYFDGYFYSFSETCPITETEVLDEENLD